VRELRVARQDSRAVVPRADRVLPEPAPDRDRRDRRDDPALDRLARELSARPARERDALLGQLARQRLDLGHLRRGKNAAADPAEASPPAPAFPPGRSVFATSRPPGATDPAARRSPCWTAPRPPTGSPSRAPHPGRDPSTPPRAAQARAAARHPGPPCAARTAPSPPTFATGDLAPSNSPRISEDGHLVARAALTAGRRHYCNRRSLTCAGAGLTMIPVRDISVHI
jgi:hypothetical protein